ncbi:hemolysin family protein [Laedolimicola ammoniilytica]|uniref:Hemolysin family protein n=1 Tax=Laedolimicola ammoniilytica TaxID=2981771 RepID=A0ABT2RWF0_9FIRM|nr:hemolysin family protein [Laedolimicola ammoniilytica]MCU6696647.1 hemolysin family protein [Laedolimicola ammoniilytica]SCH80927.1 Putative Mg2+ and Co2+ transporter CorB [uncultured Clostridium sp.]
MGTYLTIMVVCLILSSFFSATETAFSAMNTTKLKTLAEKGNKNAALVCKLDEQYSRLISTILIGNNIVNIAMASVGTVLFTLKFGDMGATLSTIVVTIVVLIFGEISPKSIANNCPEQLAMLSAPVVQFLIWIFLPLNILFVGWQKLLTKIFHLESSSKMSQEELLTLVNEVQEDGTIDEDEGGLLRNAIEFSDQEARDILIHRTDLAALPITATKDEIAEMFTETKFSRLLIYRDTIDDILGTIHRKDFYVGRGITEKEVKDIISPAIYVLESEPIRMILKKQQKAKTHVAVVVDEYGGTCGIVTMEDILEELVGEIWDEHEEAEVLLRRIAPDTYLVDASMDFEEFAEYFKLNDESEMVSVSGWVMEQFGRVPEQGDQLTYKGLEIEVTKVGNHHVDEIRVKQTVVEDEETSEEK